MQPRAQRDIRVSGFVGTLTQIKGCACSVDPAVTLFVGNRLVPEEGVRGGGFVASVVALVIASTAADGSFSSLGIGDGRRRLKLSRFRSMRPRCRIVIVVVDALVFRVTFIRR